MAIDTSATPRVAIVTGGAGGVGAATARMLARRGWRIAINYNRSAAMAAAVVDECRALGVEAISVQGDISQDAVCRRLAADAVARWGRIDALVHSAGSTKFVPITNLEGVDAQDFHDVFGVNTIGPFQMARAAAPHMPHGSAIVSVSSIAAQSGNGSSLPYVVSKAALNALTLGLARALAPKVRVNAVLPGLIEGRWMRDGLGDEVYQRVSKQYADSSLLGRVAVPDEIASAICWLLDPACLMTGQLMVVDGGFSMGNPPAAAGSR
jgi:3-oxoacyl-[acyl-carrier protein] reductase